MELTLQDKKRKEIMELTVQDKLNALKGKGQYMVYFIVPPVYTGYWSDNDWINWIETNGKYVKKT